MAHQEHKIAVLTGDIVGSTGLGSEKIRTVFDILERCAKDQHGWIGKTLQFSRHRGDGWQVILARPEMALRSALAFRTALRARNRQFDSYIGMASGAIPAPIGADLNAETDRVFTLSGAALDDLKQSKTPLRMIHNDLGPMDGAVILADRMLQGWTQAQSQAMALALDPDHPISYSDIASKLGKSRQAVTKALKAAGIEHLERALDSIERSADR